jgi:peptide/nickel transport system permease protein
VRGLWRETKVVVGGAILLGFAVIAVVGPLLVRDPTEPLGRPYDPPSSGFWLGTTGMGQDVLAQLVAGARPTLGFAFGVGAVVVVLGTLIGVTAGAVGGWIDALLSLLIDIVLVVPGLPLVVVVGAYLSGGTGTVAAVLCLTGWAWPARVLRALALSLRTRDFVAAAEVVGEGRWRIVVSELLPNMLPVIASSFVGAVVYALGALVGLEFLGVGDVERVTWGTMLYWARNDVALITGSWWTFVPAGICVGLVGGALALLGGVFDRVANPRLGLPRAYLRAVAGGHGAAATPLLRAPGSRERSRG